MNKNYLIQEVINVLPNIVIVEINNTFFYNEQLKQYIKDINNIIDNEIFFIDCKNIKIKNEYTKSDDFFKFIIISKIKQIIFQYEDNIIFFDLEIKIIENNKFFHNIILFKNTNEIVSNKKLYEINNKLYQLKFIDTLTNLPNRTSLLNDIASKKNTKAILLVNIDSFKEINNFYGFSVGDKIIKKLGIEIKNYIKKYIKLRDYLKLYKLPSDEFGILCVDENILEEKLEKIAKKMIFHIQNKKFLIDKEEIRINVSIGISNYKENLLGTADMALKTARFSKKDFVFFNIKENIRDKYENNIKWIKKLKNALETNNIVPFYQAIVNNKTMKIEKYECLVRLIDENNIIISPFHFLNIAKKTRLYLDISKIMIEKSFKKFENLDLQFSINLSIEDLLNNEIKMFIIQNLKKYNIGKKVVFEILESEGIENYEEVSYFIKDVKSYGCKIAIDDFGSGYSNFEHILKLDIDFIKIDGTLIKNLHKNKNNEIVIETINDFAKKLGIETIAEFVSNKEICEIVRKLNINYSQGYFFHEPSQDLLNYQGINDDK